MKRAAYWQMHCRRLMVALLVAAVFCCRVHSVSAQTWSFSDQTAAAHLNFQQGAGGVAAGDYDGDGWVDLYAIVGIGQNRLFHNKGDGTFESVGLAAGVQNKVHAGGPVFADYDGDGRLDLLVLGDTPPVTLYHNQGSGTFSNVTAASGLAVTVHSISGSWGDYDRDGDLDLALTHWGTTLSAASTQTLWRNNGDGTFTDVSEASGISAGIRARAGQQQTDFSFCANFADINNDAWPDLLIAADFGTSSFFVSNQDGTFTHATDPAVITDQNGMGASVADYDGDGNLDWFVDSIWNAAQGKNGNRMYRGHGDGTFEDATAATGVAVGYWGWGATFADLNNDGNIDIYQVNGQSPTDLDPTVLFVSNGNGTFTDQAPALGVNDLGIGKGVVAFDYDHDGDLDVFVNNTGASRFYRNDGGNAQSWLDVKLQGLAPNTEAIGARVYVTTGTRTQFRELRAGNNFESADPAIAHFGIGTAVTVDTLRVVWPDGAESILNAVAANQLLVVADPRSGIPTRTPTGTPTTTPTLPVVPTATGSATPSTTLTPTRTATGTPTLTPTLPFTPTATGTATFSTTPTLTRTATDTPTLTPTLPFTPTATGTATPSTTPTLTRTATDTPTLTPPLPFTPTATGTATPSTTLTPTQTPSNTPTLPFTPTATGTATFSTTPTLTRTATDTPTLTPTLPFTPTATGTATPSTTLTPTQTPSGTPTLTPTLPFTPTTTSTATPSTTLTPTRTPTDAPTLTPTLPSTPTRTATLTRTGTPTRTPTQVGFCGGTQGTCSPTPTRAAILTPTPTQVGLCGGTQGTCSPTPTRTPTLTRTQTPTRTPTLTRTQTPTRTPTQVGFCGGTQGTCTPTPTRVPTLTATRTP